VVIELVEMTVDFLHNALFQKSWIPAFAGMTGIRHPRA